MKNMGGYRNCYLKKLMFQKADVFEKFIGTSLR